MLFDDNFVMGRSALQESGFGDLSNPFGPSRFDSGEVIITGRSPGSLYVDDISSGQTLLDHIQPVITAEQLVSPLGQDSLAELRDAGQSATDAANDAVQAAPAALLARDHKDEALALPLMSGAAHDLPLIALDHLPADRPVFDAPPAPQAFAPASHNTVHDFSLGRAYQSLSFLIVDTPYAYGDDHLPATLRPSLDQLLGAAAGDAPFLLPSSHGGAWVLGEAPSHHAPKTGSRAIH
jgi:hypothetical protein